MKIDLNQINSAPSTDLQSIPSNVTEYVYALFLLKTEQTHNQVDELKTDVSKNLELLREINRCRSVINSGLDNGNNIVISDELRSMLSQLNEKSDFHYPLDEKTTLDPMETHRLLENLNYLHGDISQLNVKKTNEMQNAVRLLDRITQLLLEVRKTYDRVGRTAASAFR